jgi:pilus assembly protein CpaE
MVTHPVSGTLGNVQFMQFANAASGDAARMAAKELGFSQIHIDTGTVANAIEYLSQHASPEILVVEIGTADEAPTQLDALADVVNPHTKVLATGTVDSIRFYQWLSDLGIDGYLLQPFTAAELKQAIAKGTMRKPGEQNAKDVAKKKIVAVIGARGGVGTTMVAANLAALFALSHKHVTALVDSDPYFGTTTLSVGLDPSRGLRDAFEKPDRVDGLFLERVMVKPFTNMAILGAEEPLSDTVSIQANAGEMILAALGEKVRTIVVDVPRQMNTLTRTMLTKADHVIIVADPQLTSLRDSLRLRDYLVETLKRPTPMLVLNRVGMSATNELSVKEFAKNYGHEVTAQLPFMHEVVEATVQGELLASNPKLKPLLITLRNLSRQVVGEEEVEDEASVKSGGSLLSRLKGKK